VAGPKNLTGAEALMWALEDEPALRSTFISVSLLDRPADLARLRARLAGAATQVPVLRQRVVDAPLGLVPPWWAEDPDFDVARHVRAETVPSPGGVRELLDLAARRCAEPFDAAHPLWELTLVDGIEGGKGALLAKLHHVVSDGIGAVRLSASFLDATPDAEPPADLALLAPPPSAASGPPAPRGWLDAASAAAGLAGPIAVAGAEELRRALTEVVDGVVRIARSPATAATGAWQAAVALGRQATMLEPARSPLWATRANQHHFEASSLGLDDARAAGKALGGTVNDVFVTVVAAAAGSYHRALGAPVEELRVSVPVSTRQDHHAGRNAWAPTRVLVPTGDLTPAERLAEVHRRLAVVKSDRSLGLTDSLAASARLLPRPLLVRLARQGVSTVDLACSNVRGAPFDLWVAGAHVEANYPFGPTAGVAFNATVLSYRDSLDLGLNVDTGAVSDPALLRRCVDEAAAEVLAARQRRRARPAPRSAPPSAPPSSSPSSPPSAGGHLGGNP
jgi:WS/DGAT/MGAT family acyltransferase